MNIRAGWRRTAGAAAVVLGLAATEARGETKLLGPLRIRDMTPFNLLRLDMLPAHAVSAGPGSWAIEADISYSNTFVMSDNVMSYLEARGGRRPLTQADATAILGLGQDAYYVDGEFGLLDLTFHYALMRRSSVYLTLSAYEFTGGFLDGTIDGFHRAFGLDPNGRDLVARNRFQDLLSLPAGRRRHGRPGDRHAPFLATPTFAVEAGSRRRGQICLERRAPVPVHGNERLWPAGFAAGGIRASGHLLHRERGADRRARIRRAAERARDPDADGRLTSSRRASACAAFEGTRSTASR